MKKTFRALLAALLCVALLPAAAFAAAGDAVIARRDDPNFNDYIRGIAASGDTLYLMGESVYVWKVGDADATRYKPDETAERYIANEEGGSSGYINSMGIFVWNGELYRLDSAARYDMEARATSNEGVFYSRVTLGDGAYGIERAGQLDWEPLMEYYDEESYPRSPEQIVVIGDSLYVKTYGDNGYEVYSVPLDGGYAKQIEEIESAHSICAYTNDTLLVEEFSYDDGSTLTFNVWDPASESLELLFAQEVDDWRALEGLVADTQTGTIYGLGQGTINAFDPATMESTPVNDFPTSMFGDTSACLLEGGFYAASTYEATVIRNTDPAQRAEKTLAICNAAYADVVNRVYYDYANTHGDVSVAIASDYSASQGLVEAMMNRSSQYDIYVLRGQESAYNAVYTRGYMAELSQSAAISSFLDEMYPDLAGALRANGEIVAIPFEVSANGLALNRKALEKLGVAEADIPSNWPDFLDWLASLAPGLEEAGVSLTYEWTEQSSFRSELFEMIFADYQTYLDYAGQELGYDTPLLRDALQKLEQLDLAAFGLPEEIDWDDDNGYGWSEDDNPILFQNYTSRTINSSWGFSEYCPLLLSMSADTPALLRLDATYAFVNPYSEHKEEAVAFLETAVDALDYGVKANLVPTMNEPRRPSNWEETMESIREEYEKTVAQLEEASDEDRQWLEEAVNSYKQYLDYLENDQWEVSPGAIEWYRAHDDSLIFGKYSPLYSGEAGSEIYDLLNQYMTGGIPLDQLLRGIDQKVQMMVLEGN